MNLKGQNFKTDITMTFCETYRNKKYEILVDLFQEEECNDKKNYFAYLYNDLFTVTVQAKTLSGLRAKVDAVLIELLGGRNGYNEKCTC